MTRGDQRDLEDEALKSLYGKPREGGAKELKVVLPLEYHVRLHGLKVLTGRTISGMVNEALDAYFQSGAGKEDDSHE